MIPYVHIPTVKIFGLIPIQPFGVLVGIGLVIGYFMARRRARMTGLDEELVADSILWIVLSGFIVAHLVSVIFYFPHRIKENPLVLLAIWSGLSSFGGFVGGIIGAIVYFKKRGVLVIEYADPILFGLVPGWIGGRAGCSVVHDHPGKVTDFVLGVTCSAAPCAKPWITTRPCVPRSPPTVTAGCRSPRARWPRPFAPWPPRPPIPCAAPRSRTRRNTPNGRPPRRPPATPAARSPR